MTRGNNFKVFVLKVSIEVARGKVSGTDPPAGLPPPDPDPPAGPAPPPGPPPPAHAMLNHHRMMMMMTPWINQPKDQMMVVQQQLAHRMMTSRQKMNQKSQMNARHVMTVLTVV
ncbi:hypothetical protein RIF29_19089 [Crotalaria pallida]|uniref:Uncharacterized protein n=1 Tax=Crotalaria pallida TaxID=3830 RepID=A0AAN9F3B6_CROPI